MNPNQMDANQIAWMAGIVGALAALFGAIIGAVITVVGQYFFDSRRVAAEERKQSIKIAVNWITNGRRDSLRRVNLTKADLRGVDLSASERGNKGADLSYSKLRKAQLQDSIL